MLGRYVYGQRGLRCNVEYVSYFFFKFLEEMADLMAKKFPRKCGAMAGQCPADMPDANAGPDLLTVPSIISLSMFFAQ